MRRLDLLDHRPQIVQIRRNADRIDEFDRKTPLRRRKSHVDRSAVIGFRHVFDQAAGELPRPAQLGLH
ncbi:hypothetical protein D1872_326680 [compost metagenome]